jgi:signal peptidase I
MQTDGQGNAPTEMACGLAKEIILTFGELRLRVFGTSMAPTILPGDVVTVRRAAPSEISAGEIVLFLQKGRLFVHRVLGRAGSAAVDRPEQACLITRGDRLGHDDPPVSPDQFMGRVVCVERGDREITLDPRAPRSLLARLLCASDRMTYLYVRLFACCRSLSFSEVKCRA